MQNSKFITFEGIEGTGKSTVISFVEEKLKEKGIEVLVTREPGGTTLGNEVRQIFLNHRDEHMSGTVEALLIFAARKHHLETTITPALKAGKWVLCDRFTDSTYAYQGYGRGVDLDHISQLENMVQSELRPDKVFVLDAPAEVGLERARGRGELDRVEVSDIEFFKKSRAGFLERAKLNPGRYFVIDTTQDLDDVKSEVVNNL